MDDSIECIDTLTETLSSTTARLLQIRAEITNLQEVYLSSNEYDFQVIYQSATSGSGAYSITPAVLAAFDKKNCKAKVLNILTNINENKWNSARIISTFKELFKRDVEPEKTILVDILDVKTIANGSNRANVFNFHVYVFMPAHLQLIIQSKEIDSLNDELEQVKKTSAEYEKQLINMQSSIEEMEKKLLIVDEENKKLKGELMNSPLINISPDVEPSASDNTPTPYRKRAIPKRIKELIWNEFVGSDKRFGPCFTCEEQISITNFHAGHIIAESNGGPTNAANLRPVCAACNLSMGKMSMVDFKALINKVKKIDIDKKMNTTKITSIDELLINFNDEN